MQYRQWAPRLRDLGDCEVKHGVRLHLVNLYAEPLGNPEVPEKFRQVAASATALRLLRLLNRSACRGMKSSLRFSFVAVFDRGAGFFISESSAPPSAASTRMRRRKASPCCPSKI